MTALKQVLSPRWYQEEARDAVWSYFADGGTGNPVVALPTGTGKSVVIADLLKQILTHYPDQRVIKLTHVKELIQQNANKILEHWPLAPLGIYSAGLGRREHHHKITFAGIASVARKPELFGSIDLVFIDECHLLGPKDGTLYQQFIAGLKAANPDLKVIGFTATPYRLGQGLITDGGLFTDVCYDLTTFDGFNRLIAEGYLCPLVPKRPTSGELDVSAVKTTGGDFNQHDLQLAVDRDAITDRAIEEMLSQGQSRAHWLVFASGVEHSDHIAEALNARGVTAVSIHSKMGDEARDAAIRDWKSGRVVAAVNNNVLTTGIDFPQIDLIACLRPTKSPGLWVQMLGRGTRPYEGKENCLVLDFAGNTARLGPINDPVLPRKKGAKGGGEAPVKCCPVCGTWNHTRASHCISCGAEFTVAVKIQDTASELDILAGEAPKTVTFKVDHVEYEKHQPRDGRPPSLRVLYHCGLRRFSEFVSLENAYGLVKHKARDWWRERAGEEPPDTVDEAITPRRQQSLATPTHIKVWINKKYPEILYHYFFTPEGEVE